MNNVNVLPSERFGVPLVSAGSITTGTVNTGWIASGRFDRLCAVITFGAVAGSNTTAVTLRRASDDIGTGAELVATLFFAVPVAGEVHLVNYDVNREKGNPKRFLSIQVAGSEANAVGYSVLGLAFDTSFSPASLMNVAAVTATTVS